MRTKPHFHKLDGLRGVAALIVVLFHRRWWLPEGALTHAWLAVDFFFMLSGFVIGYAYDERLRTGRVTFPKFVVLRFERLGPMLAIGGALGAMAFALRTSAPATLVYGLPASLALPIPGLDRPFRVNGPSWSLFFELIANFGFALVAGWLTTRRLFVALLAASTLVAGLMVLANYGQIGTTWGSLIAGPLRVGAPFLGGLLIFRLWSAGTLPRLPMPFVILALLLIVVLANPLPMALGGYAALSIFIVFPLLVIASCTQDGTPSSHLSRLSAEISYPIYIIHYPLIELSDWAFGTQGSLVRLAVELAVFVLLALVLARWFDEPVRRWLASASRQKANSSSLR